MAQQSIILIAHNLRSCHNVGSLLRTAEGLGLAKVYLTGYTPYPIALNDARLPHLHQKIHKQIRKTALGAEDTVEWEHASDIGLVLNQLRNAGYTVAAVEQSPNSVPLHQYQPPPKIAILVGRELEGIEPEVLALADAILEIPMAGRKESFNVVQAAAMALYKIKFM